ncbi:MAG: hypothetical protein AAF432_06910, partial [Planctomycetota bacterium]
TLATSEQGPQLKELLDGGLKSDDRLDAIAIVRDGPGVDSAYAVAEGFVAEARAQLDGVSANAAAEAMADTAQHLLDSVRELRPTG